MPVRTIARTVALALLAAALGGCGKSPLHGGSASPGVPGYESPSSAAPDSSGAVSVVRALDGLHDIDYLALAGDYLFFSSNWNGVFRVPKTGGAVEAVEEDHSAIFTALGANSSQVLWERIRFDAQGFPHRTFLRRSIDLGPVATIVADDEIDSLCNDGVLPADDTRVIVRYLQGGDLVAISLSDGTKMRTPAIQFTMAKLYSSPGAFVLDGNTLFFESCTLNECALTKVDLGTGVAALATVMPWAGSGDGGGTPLAGGDQEHLYLLDSQRVRRLSKSDYTSVDIYRAPDGVSLGGPFVVDGSDVYFVTRGSTQEKLVAMAKDGRGSGLRVLTTRQHLVYWPSAVAQDEQRLFVLAPTEDSDEILVVPKH